MAFTNAEALFSLGFQPLKPGNRGESKDFMAFDSIGEKADRWLKILDPYLRHYRKEKIVFAPERSALLIIDMQRFFLNPVSHAFLPDALEILDNIRGLLQTYRELFLPVIFTRQAFLRSQDPGAFGRWWRDILYDDNELSEIVDELKPLPHEIVIRKTRYSAFEETNLDSLLRNHCVSQLVITGVMTHLCCETTARDAFMHNYDVFFVIDGTATRDEDLHLASLKTLSDGFALPVKTSEVLSWLRPMT